MHQTVWPLLLAGLLISLLGWALYWTGIRVVGAILGAGTGLVASLLIGAHFKTTESEFLIVSILSVVLGIVLGVILIKMLQFYFFFFLGAVIGAPLGLRFLSMGGIAGQEWASSPLAVVLVPAIFALVLGFSVVRARRYIVAISAALIGAALISISLPYENGTLIAIPCFITSVVIQTGLIRSFLPEERIDRLIPRGRKAE